MSRRRRGCGAVVTEAAPGACAVGRPRLGPRPRAGARPEPGPRARPAVDPSLGPRARPAVDPSLGPAVRPRLRPRAWPPVDPRLGRAHGRARAADRRPGRGPGYAGSTSGAVGAPQGHVVEEPVVDMHALLGDEAESLLTHESKGIPKDDLHAARAGLRRPGVRADRPLAAGAAQPAASSTTTGRLAGTGYVSILPVDQGIEHSAAASFAPNPTYFDPANIVEAGHRGRLQRGGHHVRRARRGEPRPTPTASRSSSS